MKGNAGWLAGVLVVLGLVGVSNLPKSSDTPAAGESKKGSSSQSGARRSAPQPYSPCAEIVDRLRRFAIKASAEPNKWKLPESCYEPGTSQDKLAPAKLSPAIGFAIAIVPNPVSTHLPLFFDRMVETIQQAAQDEGFSYDDSWFPWEIASKEYSSLADQQAADALQKIELEQPGVVVFRQGLGETTAPSYQGGLVVFLVSEKPTGGVDDDQFKNAVAWIHGLEDSSGQGHLRILGPTFSGSLPSLQRALDVDLPAKGDPARPEVHVWSGTVSSGRDYQWFSDWIGTWGGKSFFRTANENDSLAMDRFCQYLQDQQYDTRYIAFLSEDETAFGGATPNPKAAAPAPTDQSAPQPCGNAIKLYYPRDIATLRSAYQRQAILGESKQNSASAPSTALRGDLSEPSGGDHDTVRSYGGQLTPLAQEAVLFDIASRLSDKQIEFIILRSTSSLDQIFLSEFLRRAYPEGRVVIDGADLLFTRGAEGRSLRGVMLLSTYPLLTEEQEWTRSTVDRETGKYRTFGADTAEGVYIAARRLLRNGITDVPIGDNRAPSWAVDSKDRLLEDSRPSTWLTVIGHRQFWPLAVLNSNTLPSLNTTAKSITELLAEPGLDARPGPLTLPTMTWFLIIAFVAWSVIHAYYCANGCIKGLPRGLAYFAPIPNWQHPALIALGSALIALLAITLASASGLLSWLVGKGLYQLGTGAPLAALLLMSLVLAALAVTRNYDLTKAWEFGSRASAKEWQRRAWRTALVCLAVCALGHVVLVIGLTRANRFPAYWRSINLLSGVSPLLPQLFFIAGGYLWFWCTLRGLAHFGEDRPVLPSRGDLPPLLAMFSREETGHRIEAASQPLTSRYLKLLAAVFGLVTFISCLALGGPWVRTLGERAFGILIFVFVVICIAVIVADGIEMWRAWCQLRGLLIYLDRLPLRRTLRALKGLEWGSVWKLSGNVLEERYKVISFQFESLRHLRNTTEEWTPGNPFEVTARNEILEKLAVCRATGNAFVQWYTNLPAAIENLAALREFQAELAATAAHALTRILLPAWQKEKESLIFDRTRLKEEPNGEHDTPIPTDQLKPHVLAAEEFFVLPYLAFIQNTLGRLRTITLGGLWLFVGATFAVSSYPFDPLSVLGAIFLGAFLIVGGLTVLAYSQMSRDATLSHITNTRPGELGSEFWIRLITFGVGPLFGLLTTLFPSITDFVFSWLQPSVQALK